MPTTKDNAPAKNTSGEELYHARITTKSAEQMLELLKGRPLEKVGRGPHQHSDGSFFVDVIAPKEVLEALPKGDWSIVIREPRDIKDADKQLSKTNRYAKKGAIPKGVGDKK